MENVIDVMRNHPSRFLERSMTNDVHRKIERGIGRDEILKRFGLVHGQYFAYYEFKNLWWVLDGKTVGYGDLRKEDIENIQSKLSPQEVFIGWHESHGTDFQQTKEPMIRITKNGVTYPHKDARKQ